jgi:hypothetical protein
MRSMDSDTDDRVVRSCTTWRVRLNLQDPQPGDMTTLSAYTVTIIL